MTNKPTLERRRAAASDVLDLVLLTFSSLERTSAMERLAENAASIDEKLLKGSSKFTTHFTLAVESVLRSHAQRIDEPWDVHPSDPLFASKAHMCLIQGAPEEVLASLDQLSERILSD